MMVYFKASTKAANHGKKSALRVRKDKGNSDTPAQTTYRQISSLGEGSDIKEVFNAFLLLTMISKTLHELHNGAGSLPNGNVDAVQLFAWRKHKMWSKQSDTTMHTYTTTKDNLQKHGWFCLLSSWPSLKRFWLRIASSPTAVFLFNTKAHREDS